MQALAGILTMYILKFRDNIVFISISALGVQALTLWGALLCDEPLTFQYTLAGFMAALAVVMMSRSLFHPPSSNDPKIDPLRELEMES